MVTSPVLLSAAQSVQKTVSLEGRSSASFLNPGSTLSTLPPASGLVRARALTADVGGQGPPGQFLEFRVGGGLDAVLGDAAPGGSGKGVILREPGLGHQRPHRRAGAERRRRLEYGAPADPS